MKQFVIISGIFLSTLLFACSRVTSTYSTDKIDPKKLREYFSLIKANQKSQTVLYLHAINDEMIINNGKYELFHGQLEQIAPSVYFTEVLIVKNKFPISIQIKKSKPFNIVISKSKLRKYKFVTISKIDHNNYHLNFSNKPITIREALP